MVVFTYEGRGGSDCFALLYRKFDVYFTGFECLIYSLDS